MLCHPSPLHWLPNKQQNTGKVSTMAPSTCPGALGSPPPAPLSTPWAWAPAPALLRSILCVVNNSPARWRGVAGSPCKPIAHAVGPCGAVGRRPGNWPKPHTPSTPCLPCGLWPPQLRGTGGFKHGWPNGVPGDRYSHQGEQVELQGGYTVRLRRGEGGGESG